MSDERRWRTIQELNPNRRFGDRFLIAWEKAAFLIAGGVALGMVIVAAFVYRTVFVVFAALFVAEVLVCFVVIVWACIMRHRWRKQHPERIWEPMEIEDE